MITGTIAPPMIAVFKMPENDPWCSATELSASDTMIGHITDANNPTVGNAKSETLAGPNSAADKLASPQTLVATRIFRQSKTFSSSIPRRHPAVSSPQNHDTVVAPVVCA